MEEWFSTFFRKWWQKIKKRPYTTGNVIFLVVMLFIFLAYIIGWGWTGFNSGTSQITITSDSKVNYTATIPQPSKSLWDWLQLLAILAIPVVVALGAAWYTGQQAKVTDRENTDNQRETALQAYIDKMSELLLEKNLRNSAEEDEVRKIARVRTLTVLPRLDSGRKRSVLQFLQESGMIDKGKCIINLAEADLTLANLREARLRGADLHATDLRGAHLEEANLERANLAFANLREANLDAANLHAADLDCAYLNGASLGSAFLVGANLDGAELPGANLCGAFLGGANLCGAKLPGANLEGINLGSTLDLYGADLQSADLQGANLREARLWGADLRGADLKGADLRGAFLAEAELLVTVEEAFPTVEELEGVPLEKKTELGHLRGANLDGANLCGANLDGAEVALEQLNKTKSLKGATMPDGSKHP